MLVGTNDGCLEQEVRQFGIAPERLEQPSPNPTFAPPVELFVDRVARPESFRQIAPRSAGACGPEHSILERAVVPGCSSRVTVLARLEGLDRDPLFMRKFMTPHLKLFLETSDAQLITPERKNAQFGCLHNLSGPAEVLGQPEEMETGSEVCPGACPHFR
jgi:hypothetical protein